MKLRSSSGRSADGARNLSDGRASYESGIQFVEAEMGLGKGALLWLLGIPLPIIIILALLWHN
jgi:hypothetical protein